MRLFETLCLRAAHALLVSLIFFNVSFARHVHGQVEKVNENRNPFSLDASIRSKIDLIDRSSPGLSWDNMVVGFGGSDTTQYVYREWFARTQKLSNEVVAAVDEAFKVRAEAHGLHYKVLRTYELREINIARSARGSRAIPGDVATSAPEPKLIEDLLKEYEAKELKSELELVAKLDKLLTPQQFEVLIDQWMTLDNLYIPIVAKYLELSDEQNERIKVACMERRKFGFEMSERYPNLFAKNDACLASPEWHELNYLGLACLTHKQFKRAAGKLMTSWKSQPTFAAKLEEVLSSDSLQSKAELKMLENLYRTGIALDGVPDDAIK